MQLTKEVDEFSKSCEHLICEASMSGGRKLTNDEASLIEYYCLEVMEKRKLPRQDDSANGELRASSWAR
jgi:hypothetical protein